jgi:predicted negative regulator of RcsB-dependent stress response
MSDVVGPHNTFQKIYDAYDNAEPGTYLHSTGGRTLFLDPAVKTDDLPTEAQAGVRAEERTNAARAVRQALVEEYGLEIAGKVLRNVGAAIGRDLGGGVRRRDLDLIKWQIENRAVLLPREDRQKLASASVLSWGEIDRLWPYVSPPGGNLEVTLCAVETPTEVLEMIQTRMSQVAWAAQPPLLPELKLCQAALASMDPLDKDEFTNDRQYSLTGDAMILGNVQQAQGKFSAALKSYRAALAILDTLAEIQPEHPYRQHDLSVCHGKIGDMQLVQGKLPAALDSYQAALDIAKRLVEANPGDRNWQHDLSRCHGKIGDRQLAQGKLPAALESHQAALDITKQLAEAEPEDPDWQRDLSICHEKIGDVQLAQGKFSAALESYRATLDITKRLAEAKPGNADRQRDLERCQELVATLEAVIALVGPSPTPSAGD